VNYNKNATHAATFFYSNLSKLDSFVSFRTKSCCEQGRKDVRFDQLGVQELSKKIGAWVLRVFSVAMNVNLGAAI